MSPSLLSPLNNYSGAILEIERECGRRTSVEVNPDELIGSIIDGQFQIEHRLSSGGMADVYVAKQLEFGRICVVKVQRKEHMLNEDFIAAFKNESTLLERIHCPQVVSLYGRGAVDQRFWIALEYLSGGDTAQAVQSSGPPTFDLAARWLVDTLRGLQYLHESQGIVHCDIKPNNLLIDNQRNLKIADFGLSRLSRTKPGSAGAVIGTPLFMAPEQARGEVMDVRSDLFSLGSSFYYILTGCTSCLARKASDALAMIARDEYRCLGLDIPVGLRVVVNRLMQSNPSDRYQTAAVALADLESYVINSQHVGLSSEPRRISNDCWSPAEASTSTRLPLRDLSIH